MYSRALSRCGSSDCPHSIRAPRHPERGSIVHCADLQVARLEEHLDGAAHHLAQDVTVPICEMTRPHWSELRPCLLDVHQHLLSAKVEAMRLGADHAHGAL